MPIHRILQLISRGESEKLDFKKTISSASKIAKTLSAFANHKGGTLLVGVNDNGKISGVKSEDEKYMLDLAAGFFCKPEVRLDMKEWNLAGKIVIEAVIPEGKEKPYFAKDEAGKWIAHIRVLDQSLLASKVVIEVLKRSTANRGTLIRFTHHEEGILRLFEKQHKLTQKEICHKLNISKWRAQKMLVNLVSLGIIRNHTTEKEEFYTLS